MVQVRLRFLWLLTFPFLLILLAPPFCSAEENLPTLTVTAMEAHLYARQDEESEIIANLEKGEVFLPVGQAVGTGLWYMVKTPKGAIGWVQSSDVRGVSLPEDPVTIGPAVTIPGSRPIPAGAYNQPGMITQPGYRGPAGHTGPVTPKEHEAAAKNIDRQRIQSRSNGPYQVNRRKVTNLPQCLVQADAAYQTRRNNKCAILGKARGCLLLTPVAADLDQAHRGYRNECYKRYGEY